MSVSLGRFSEKAQNAVRLFWQSRDAALQKQEASGRRDQGERASVTAGKHLDGFIDLVVDVVAANGLVNARIMRQRQLLTLPGFFRPTKVWGLLILHENRLVAAIELKSQVGPSFGNNANNRAEEAVGSAADLWKAFREGAFGESTRPFMGYLFLLEDVDQTREPVRTKSIHYPILPEFENASYADRYNILRRKLVQENLYSAACLILSPRAAVTTGEYREMDELTSLRSFLATLAGHVAAEAVR